MLLCLAALLAPADPGFWVRPGYKVEVVAQSLGDARFMEVAPDGRLFLSRPRSGDILVLKKKGKVYEKTGTFVSSRASVHGLCWHDGWLWFSQTGSIHKARDKDGDGTAEEVVTVIKDGDLPRGGGHWWRSLLVTDEGIWTSIGDAGNISDQTDTERQKVWKFALDGTGKKLWSSGVRNNEKLRLRPGTKEVWGMDHGSDWWGGPIGDKQGRQPMTDLNPPDEFNCYTEGAFYGHPFITGLRVPRIEFHSRPDLVELAEKTVPPAWCFGAHWAMNGFTFLNKSRWPDHKGDAFCAAHGSWNSSKPVGYSVVRVLWDEATGQPYGSLDVVRCHVDGKRLGRPVDCVEEASGDVLFSCDDKGAIYRITR